MNIEPPSPRPREISVTEPITLAYERMKWILFRPFDLGRWFALGFCAWLACLGESGGGFSYGNHSQNFNNGQPWNQIRHACIAARDYTLANLGWLVPAVVVGALVLLGVGLLILWLNCRGKFMFLHCVAANRAEIGMPWDRYGAVADRLFWFRLLLAVAGSAVALPFLIAIGFLVYQMIVAGEPDVPTVLIIVGLGAVLVFWGLTLLLIRKFLTDFVVPIMFLRGGTCLAACREFSGLFTAHVGAFALYLLLQFALGMGIAALLGVIFIFTCCIACCVAQLPYIGTVLILPILVFQRSYSLYFLAQFGPSYDVFPLAVPPVASVPSPGLQPL